AGKAPTITRNPKNAVAVADFPFGFDNHVKGSIVFTAKRRGKIGVHVDMTGLPPSGGPFYYHIHDHPIPEDGNCDVAGGRFDPYDGVEDCDSVRNDAYCRVGDLSGKHGWINTTCFETQYTDLFLSLNRKSDSYIVGKSVVFHYENMTSFACSNIELASLAKIESMVKAHQIADPETVDELQKRSQDDYIFDDATLNADLEAELERELNHEL
ncbi:Cu,Zn superoxide dismutase-like protein, partial [Suhomyces tanzawaensis NRRL Y-17324]